MKQRVMWAVVAALLAAANPGWALGPHECVILVNRRSMASMELANYYADLRKIPAANVIHLDLPPQALEANASFTPGEFREHIYDPVMKILQERHLLSHILVWLYSLDFPPTISATPAMSLTGITFTRGQPPPSEHIQSGLWLSSLYRGPDRADSPASPPISLEQFTIRLTTNMPLPSMMLGWSGSRGMPLDRIKEQLRVSAASDGAHPSASVFFENIDDIRSQTRAWQFESATRELAPLGVLAITASNPPAARTDLMGIMSGRAVHQPATYGILRPGAYADHLTSFAAHFHDPYQTKLTEWLRNGAAGSSGTVVEPGSLEVPVMLWSKFPTARLFVHYASGCTLIESLFQATRSPLQVLFVGDALANPWAKPPGISLISMAEDGDKPLRGPVEFMAGAWGGFGQQPPVIVFFLDGRPVVQPGKNRTQLELDTAKLYDGYHEVRVVAYLNEAIRHQGFDTKGFVARNRNRGVVLSGYQDRQKVDLYRPLEFKIEAEGAPGEAALVVQERIVSRTPFTNGMTLSVHPMLVGAGPVSFQAVVVYDGKEPVRSAPLTLEIAALNTPPVITSITHATNDALEIEWAMSTADGENDPVETLWYGELLRSGLEPQVSPAPRLAQLERGESSLTLSATSAWVAATYKIEQPNKIREIRSRFRFVTGGQIRADHRSGIIFNYRDENNYMVWGAHGQLSAWALMRVQDGREEVVLSRGAYIEIGREYTLMAAQVGPQKIALFVDDDVKAVADTSFGPGRIGVRGGLLPVHYEQILISPPSAVYAYFREQDKKVNVPVKHADQSAMIVAGARDGQFTTTRKAVKP